jgi:gas vesicle protein
MQKMKTHDKSKSPYLLIAMGLGTIVGLVLAPRWSEKTRKLLRERADKSLDYLKRQTTKLRDGAETILKKGTGSVGSHSEAVKTDTEGERQAYEEKKREHMGG